MATALPPNVKPDRIACAEIRAKLLGPTPALMAKMAFADGHGVTYGQTQLHTCSQRSMQLLDALAASLEQDLCDAVNAGEAEYPNPEEGAE